MGRDSRATLREERPELATSPLLQVEHENRFRRDGKAASKPGRECNTRRIDPRSGSARKDGNTAKFSKHYYDVIVSRLNTP